MSYLGKYTGQEIDEAVGKVEGIEGEIQTLTNNLSTNYSNTSEMTTAINNAKVAVVDGLTSESATNALSAKQGKVLGENIAQISQDAD